MTRLKNTEELEQSAIVANCRMNRERDLTGSNGYERDLRFNPLEFLTERNHRETDVNWLDLCCGSGKALIQAANIIEQQKLSISIVGVDLVDMFLPYDETTLDLNLIAASLSNWSPKKSPKKSPKTKFDLITCVHGIHYVGDKVELMLRAQSWLKPNGKFVANLDPTSLKTDLETERDNHVLKWLGEFGFDYSAKHNLVKFKAGECETSERQPCDLITSPFEFLGADDQAGPNYTGQPAVNSHYRFQK